MSQPDTASPTDAESAPIHQLIGIAVVLGAAGAVAALAFVAVISAGQSVLWPDSIDPSAFSGSIRIPIIMTTGAIDAKAIPGGVLIALVTLIAGFSLVPEVPTGMATSPAERRNATKWKSTARRRGRLR